MSNPDLFARCLDDQQEFLSEVTMGSEDIADEHDYIFVQQIAQEMNQFYLPIEQVPVTEIDELEEATQRDRVPGTDQKQ